MRLVLVMICVSLHLIGIAQSKKKQIQILNAKIYSLIKVQYTEKQNFETRKTELESSLSNSDYNTSKLLKTLSTKKEKLNNQIQENQKLEQEVLSLQMELKTMQDSIKTAINKMPCRLLDSGLINITNEKLINLMNVQDKDLGELFVSYVSPDIKPIYEINGKQLFELKRELYCMVVMGVTNPNDYHMSEGTNFIACFKIKENQWSLVNPPFNTSYNPGVGFGNPAWIDKFVLFGDQSLAIILEGGYTQNGYSSGKRAIYGLNNLNQISLIYEGISSEDDQGTEGSIFFRNIDDKFEINFQKISKANHYDLVEIEKSHGKKVKTRILKFNEKSMKYE